MTGLTVEGNHMSEMENGVGQSSSNFAPQPVSTPSTTPSNAPADERTFKQSEVNDLVGRAKSEAVERYRRESSMASHQPVQQQQQYAPSQQQHQPPYVPPVTQYNGLSADEARRIAAEQFRQSRDEWVQESQRNVEEQNAQRIASEFYTKVGAGEGGVQAFEKQVAESGLDLRSIPYHVQLANMVDNTKEVMTELIQNPTKIGQIQNLIDIDLRAGRQPNLAFAEMKRLSQSIKDNAQGARFRSPNDPLSQMKPSNAGTGDKGKRTAADYRKDPRYRI